MQVKRTTIRGCQPGALALLVCLFSACDGLVGASVECDKICITAVGPTVPGIDLPVDGGLPDGLAAQPAVMEFNVPLAQLSKALAEVDVEAHLSSLRLLGQADLAFVDRAQVILHAGTTDGGVRPSDASPPDAARSTPGAAGGAPSLAPIDAGATPILADDLPDILGCLPGGPGLVVANYRKPAAATATVGRSIDLDPTTREDNLYPCLREAPAKFGVVLEVAPAYLPSSETPISLKVCIGARASASFP
jgi:hypothetical protein